MNTTILRPQFKHECGSCRLIEVDSDIDWYICPQAGLPTLLGRFGSDEPSYWSMPHSIIIKNEQFGRTTKFYKRAYELCIKYGLGSGKMS